MLQPLDTDKITLVHKLQTELGVGDKVTKARWLELEKYQQNLANALSIANEPLSAREPFKLIREQNEVNPLIGPRWWFHLLGLRHGVAHIVLTTPQNWVIIQRRDWNKDDSPGALDVSVSGHIGVADPLDAAWREMQEEVGLTKAEKGEEPSIVGNSLELVCTYDVTILKNSMHNPPYIDNERRWVFTAKLTPEGMARLRFMDGEVTSLMLIGPRDLQRLISRCVNNEYSVNNEIDIASGLIKTLPLLFTESNI